MALRASPQSRVGIAQIPQVLSLAPPVANLAVDGQRLLVVLNGLARIAQSIVGIAQIPQRDALAPPVANLAGDGQILLVALDGLARIAQSMVGIRPGSPSAAPSPRRSPISRSYGQRLLVVLDGLARIAQSCMGQAQIPQRAGFLLPLVGRLGRLGLRFQPFDTLPRMETKVAHIGNRTDQLDQQPRRLPVFSFQQPAERRLDLRPLPIKQGEALTHLGTRRPRKAGRMPTPPR